MVGLCPLPYGMLIKEAIPGLFSNVSNRTKQIPFNIHKSADGRHGTPVYPQGMACLPRCSPPAMHVASFISGFDRARVGVPGRRNTR